LPGPFDLARISGQVNAELQAQEEERDRLRQERMQRADRAAAAASAAVKVSPVAHLYCPGAVERHLLASKRHLLAAERHLLASGMQRVKLSWAPGKVEWHDVQRLPRPPLGLQINMPTVSKSHRRALTGPSSMLSPNTSLLAPNPYPTLDPSPIAALTQCQLDYVGQRVEYTKGKSHHDP